MTLLGKNIVITNEKEPLRTLLMEQGAKPLVAPCLLIKPLPCLKALDAGIDKLKNGYFTHVVFTSQNAVKAVHQRIQQRGLVNNLMAEVKVAVIGHKTAAMVMNLFGIKAVVYPLVVGAGQLMTKLNLDLKDRVFFPKSNIAMPTVVEFLDKHGIEYHVADAYQVVENDINLGFLINQPLDAICFFSPSAVKSFLNAWFKSGQSLAALQSAAVACIGLTTATYAQKHGLSKVIVAKEPSAFALVDRLAGYFNESA